MNKLPESLYCCHNQAWVNHLKKVVHSPENSRISSNQGSAQKAVRERSCASRWEQQLQDSEQ